ncbi:DUF1318 domain-containing protein [bacterium]|nr:DUF1318 domain-containing protein [bacterium]
MCTFKNLFITKGMLLILTLGCSIHAPEVRVTGEKTALEREVIGTYEEMEEDTWMIASTRAVEGESETKVSPEKRAVLEALQNQKYNRDDIDEFKTKGYVGENNQGLLEIRSLESLEQNPEQIELVRTVVQEENENRKTIMERVIELNDSLKKAVREDVLSIFARINQENSDKGTWIQEPNGSWVVK